jgi:hypothetical protein
MFSLKFKLVATYKIFPKPLRSNVARLRTQKRHLRYFATSLATLAELPKSIGNSTELTSYSLNKLMVC